MWEYMVIDVPKHPLELASTLRTNQEGGWELLALYERIQPVVAIGGTVLVGVFRRMSTKTEPQQ